MQRFTLIHDGSDQGWQAVYLALHIAARLGAPLLVLLTNTITDKKKLTQRAAQVEVGGRAANVTIETRFLEDISARVVADNAGENDGLFAPRSLIPDEKAAMHYLDALSCPIWIVSQESKKHKFGILISNWIVDKQVIPIAIALSRRLQQPLTGFFKEEEFPSIPQIENVFSWIHLSNFSPEEIHHTLKLHDIDILFIPKSNASLINDLTSNCVLLSTA